MGEFSDNDVSALKGKRRPQYEALLDLVRSGGVDRVVVFHTSRLWRNRRERAEGIDLFAKHRVSIVPVKGSPLDLSTAAGRAMVGLLGEFDTMESELKSERVARASQQRAERGKRNGALPYGWRVEDGEDVEDELEAGVVREIVDRLLAGESLNAVTLSLNERGLTSPYGKAWGASSVRKLAMRETNVARRVYKGEVIGKGLWPAIVDEGKHERVKALLADPARRQSRGGARRHLLSFGIGECGVCGERLRVAVKRPKGREPMSLYVCDGKGCVGRRQERVDELVEGVVLERLGRADVADLYRPVADDGAREKVLALRARLDTAADDYAEGAIDGDQLRRITAKLRPQLEEAERAVAASLGVGSDALRAFAAGDARRVWDGYGIGQRRAVLEALGLRVIILRTRQGAGFDPESVAIEWNARGLGREA